MAQGLGQDLGCRNETFFNETSNDSYIELVPNQVKPNYSVDIYFIFMFLLLVMSTSSFTFLNFSKYAIKRRKSNSISSIKNAKVFPDTDFNLKFYGSVEEENKDPRNYPFAVKREKILLFTYGFILSFTSYGIINIFRV